MKYFITDKKTVIDLIDGDFKDAASKIVRGTSPLHKRFSTDLGILKYDRTERRFN